MSTTWKDIEREYILRAIIDCEGEVSRIVKMTGLSKATVYNKIKRYDLENDLAVARLTRSKRDRMSGDDSSGGMQ